MDPSQQVTMPLGRKLLVSMVTPALLILVMGGVGVVSLDHLKQAAGRILSNNYQTIQYAREMERALWQMEAAAGAVEAPGGLQTHRLTMADIFESALRGSEGNVTEAGESPQRFQRSQPNIHWPLLASSRNLHAGGFTLQR